MSGRPPNEHESKIHQAALSDPKKEVTAKQVETLIPDAKIRQNALNFLLGVGLIKSKQDTKGRLVAFRAVSKNELNATKDLSGEESLVLGHIKSSANEGIWTKHLKAKTNLHQTVIDRCLKTLTQKNLIKRVPSVQHPTRKLYMLEHLEPSVALTGGPWYTDNELDTEFIKLLNSACLRFIQEKSFPKRRSKDTQQPVLFAISNAPQYPTAQQVQGFLKQSRITETELSVEHVEMLLNVLVLDGEVEKVPAFGTSLWDSTAINDADDSDDDGERTSKKKKKRKKDDEGRDKKRRKRKRDDTESSDESSDERFKKSKRKRPKKEQTSDDDNSDDDRSSKNRKKKSKKRKHTPPDSESESTKSGSESESGSESDDHRSRRKTSKSRKRSSSPAQAASWMDDFSDGVGAHVYRAVRQEKIALGWSQAPCGGCPSFDFCKDEGPVNPRDCVYYGDWLPLKTVKEE